MYSKMVPKPEANNRVCITAQVLSNFVAHSVNRERIAYIILRLSQNKINRQF